MNNIPDEPAPKAQKKPSGCLKFFWGAVTLFTLALTLSAQRACHRERQSIHQSNQPSYSTTVWIYDGNFGKMMPHINAQIRSEGPGFISFISYGGRLIDYSGQYRVERILLPKPTPRRVEPIQAPPQLIAPKATPQQMPSPTHPPAPTFPPGYPKEVTAKWDIEIPLKHGKAIVRKGQKFTVFRPLGDGRYEAKHGAIEFLPYGAEFK